MAQFTPTTVNLDQIVGRSELNARPDNPNDDVSGLAKTIEMVGLMQPIMLIQGDDGLRVLAGWRRTKALRYLAAHGKISFPYETPVLLFMGDRSEARAASIAENTERRALHPAEEAEAFARLSESGHSIGQIANFFCVTARHVEGRLALGKLCPEAIARWRSDGLTLEIARALSYGTHEQQIEILSRPNFAQMSALMIRKALNPNGVRGDDERAQFIGEDIYLAEGGTIIPSLFEDEAIWTDEALLDRLVADELHRVAGQIIDEEGWGAALIDPGWDERKNYVNHPSLATIDEHLNDKEKSAVAALEELIENLSETDGVEYDDPRILSAQERAGNIRVHALLRAIPQTERAALHISVSLDDGRIEIERALRLREVAAAPAKPARAEPVDEIGADNDDDAIISEASKLSQFAESAIECGLRDAIRTRPDLALAVLAAALAQAGVGINCDIAERPRTQLAIDLCGMPNFETAMATIAGRAQGDIVVAVADLVASIIDMGNDQDSIIAAALKRGSALSAHVAADLDYLRYFEIAGADGRAAFWAASGRTEPQGLKKADAIARAARTAQELRWIPPIIARQIESDEPQPAEAAAGQSLAQAMDEAIADDESTSDVGEGTRTRLMDFVGSALKKAPKGRLKMSEAFSNFQRLYPDIQSVQTFGAVARECGFITKRLSHGVHILAPQG